MGDKLEGQLTFETYNRHTWKIFILSIIRQISLLIMLSVAIFSNSKNKLMLLIIILIIGAILLIWEMFEIKTIKILRIEYNKLIYHSEIILPNEINEIVIMKDYFEIRKKNSNLSNKLLRVSLKNREEAENLKNELVTFSSNNHLRLGSDGS